MNDALLAAEPLMRIGFFLVRRAWRAAP